MLKRVNWSASNMVGGSELCVWTRQGWARADGAVLGFGPTPTLFGWPSVPLSPRVLQRVRRELSNAGYRQ